MCPSNLKIGHDDEEDEGDVEIKVFLGEARNTGPDLESLSPPGPESSRGVEGFFAAFEEAIEVNSDGRRALDGSGPEACGSK